uniref:hypothetical protein n=1 Tax=Penaeicola halotolerans TaxID=2793196 RepID=UPI001CF7F83F
MKKLLLSLLILALGFSTYAQNEQKHAYKFEQLGTMLRSPNVYRTASGAPGHLYWQQKAAYKIQEALEDAK